jgi:hypothetical protein
VVKAARRVPLSIDPPTGPVKIIARPPTVFRTADKIHRQLWIRALGGKHHLPPVRQALLAKQCFLAAAPADCGTAGSGTCSLRRFL